MSAASRIFHFARALAAFAGDGCRLVDRAAYETRLEACAACPHRAGVRCGLCGCRVAFKARARAWVCPAGRWPPWEPHREIDHDQPG
jgi:hypothetical protein